MIMMQCDKLSELALSSERAFSLAVIARAAF